LIDISVAEREMQVRGTRIARDQLLDTRFRRLRVRAPEQADQSRLRQRIARIEFQHFHVVPAGGIAIALLAGDVGEPQVRVDTARVAFEQLIVELLRRFQFAGRERRVRID
jgi:hypothetical protein